MIEPTLDWEQVAREAKEIADAHGWNNPPEDDATHAVNVLCELFEAWQLYRAGHEVDEPITCEGAGCQMRKVCKERCDQYKPYGIAVELADAVLRVLSRTGELRGLMTIFRVTTAADTRCAHSYTDGLEDLILYSMDAINGWPDYGVDYAAMSIILWCWQHNVPIEDAIRQKMEYNRKRPWRHGGKRV